MNRTPYSCQAVSSLQRFSCSVSAATGLHLEQTHLSFASPSACLGGGTALTHPTMPSIVIGTGSYTTLEHALTFTSEQKQFWDANGYLVVEDAFDAGELDRLRASLADLESKALGIESTTDRFIFTLFGGDGGERKVQQIAEPHEFGGDFVTLARDPRILEVVEGVLGPDILLYYSMLMMKPPGAGAPAPWHQDMAFFVHDNARLMAAQVYLDDSNLENGCVRVVPGSHRLGLLNHFDGDRFAGVVQGNTEDYDAQEVTVQLKAGSIAFWHCLTLHKSHPNLSPNARRAVVFEYKDPGARLMSGSFAKTEVRQAGMMMRGSDPRGELLPAF